MQMHPGRPGGPTSPPPGPTQIDFRELLARLLPLEELPAVRGRSGPEALRERLSTPIEGAGRLALAELERPAAGAATRHAPPPGPKLPQTPAGVTVIPRAELPAGAQARIEQVRRLVRFDDPLLYSENRQGNARECLIQQLATVGRDVLHGTQVRLLPVEHQVGTSPQAPFDATLARLALEHPGCFFYCPDTDHAPALTAEARERGARSLVVAGVTSREGAGAGVLEITSAEPDPFAPEDLALVSLLADGCAGALDRATRIEKLMFIDPLTSAYNRSYFELQVQNEMARAHREQGSMALCIADIDDFKNFNTRFGYYAGNQVLVQVAQTLRGGVRPFDSVARWGGEEFTVLLTAPVLPHDVLTISERLRTLVERQQVWIRTLRSESQQVPVTVSIGVALFPDHGGDAASLWRAANQALLAAKQPPKNRVVFYTPELDAAEAAGGE